MKRQSVIDTGPTLGRDEILKEEVYVEYSRLIRNAGAMLSEEPTAKVVCIVLKEARKALSKELIDEAKIVNPSGGYTKRYLILEVVRQRLENDITQVDRNIIPGGVSNLMGVVPSHDDARTKNGRAKYLRDE